MPGYGIGRIGHLVAAAVVVVTTVAGAMVGGGDGDWVDEWPTLVMRDGDHVVFDAKGATASAPAVGGDGYTTYGHARTLLESYTIGLVDSPDIERVRPFLEEAAATIRAESGQQIVVQPAYAANQMPGKGEIAVVVTSRSPCGGPWLGCGAPTISDGEVQAGAIWLSPRLFSKSDDAIANTVRHELGHALGLGHYPWEHEGRIQTMHPTSFDAHGYQSGDLNGFRALAGTPPGHVAAAPSAAPAPADVSPAGALATVRSTAVGVVVRGQAQDPETADPIPVVVTMDGTPFELVASREDPATGDTHGFEVVWSVPPGPHEVCVVARNVGAGTDTPLGCEQVTVSSAGIGRVGLQTL